MDLQKDQNQNVNDADATKIFRIPSADTTIPDLSGVGEVSNPTLTIAKGPHTGMVFNLETPEITIGRDPSNTIFLNDMTVSRHHAKINLAEADYGLASIEDLGSLNGTWVDGAIINKAILQDGSTIQIGTFRLIFHTQRTTPIATGR